MCAVVFPVRLRPSECRLRPARFKRTESSPWPTPTSRQPIGTSADRHSKRTDLSRVIYAISGPSESAVQSENSKHKGLLDLLRYLVFLSGTDATRAFRFTSVSG